MVITDFWRRKKVLVTGHTGFKGSWLSLWLQKLGASVCGLALQPNTVPSLFELANVAEGMESHIGDIRDYSVVEKLLSKFNPNIIIHMAAQPLVRYSYDNPVETYATNVMGTVNLLDAARKCTDLKAFVNVTTDKCYENKEWIWGYRENEAVGGYDPYSNSKGCSELVTNAYRDSFYQHLEKGLASARAGNVIGGGDWAQDRLIADIMRSITAGEKVCIRNPKAIRPWQHVLEPLSGYLQLAEKLFCDPSGYSQAWNFGPYPHEAANVEHIVKTLFSFWDGANKGWELEENKQNPHEANFLKLDISKALGELAWQPKLSLDETLQWVVAWYQGWQANENMQDFTLQQINQYERM